MGEKLIHRLGNLIRRGKGVMESAVENQYDPKTSAQDFARFVEASVPYHLEFGNMKAFFLNLEPEPRKPEYKDKLRERGIEILNRARITPQFRDYIVSQLLTQFQLGMPLDTDYNLKEYAGVDLSKEEYGIFDPKKAKGFEKEVLGKMLTHEDELSMMFATGVAGIDLDEWKKSFRALRKEKPI